MLLSRRQLITSLTAGVALGRHGYAETGPDTPDQVPDWDTVRSWFPLAPEWVHLAGFFLVSHPRPVADAIARFRARLDADPCWLEEAAFTDPDRPLAAVKAAIAEYLGGRAGEIGWAPNTTTALALVYHGLRVRPDQEILTTEHDHYSQHESIRYAAARTGCGVRYISLYQRPAAARAGDMVDRLARAIGPRTRAVGITWVHSSTGVKLPLAPIAEVVARANRGRDRRDRCLLIVDGVHGLGNQDVDVAATGCDFFAAGIHKWMLGPRGTGFLWGRQDAWPEIRPTIPSFDPDGQATWDAWMTRGDLPPTRAAFVSPGGFQAFEYLLAVPAAFALHRQLGRNRIARRIAELNDAFRQGAAALPNLTLHTPMDPEVAGGISCFEVPGRSAEAVTRHLARRKIRTNPSPYRVSYARVSAGLMNSVEDIDRVLRALRAL